MVVHIVTTGIWRANLFFFLIGLQDDKVKGDKRAGKVLLSAMCDMIQSNSDVRIRVSDAECLY
jgi:hypothetical protein